MEDYMQTVKTSPFHGRPLRGRRRKPIVTTNSNSSTSTHPNISSSSARAPPAHVNSNKTSKEPCMGSPSRIAPSKYFDAYEVFERLNQDGFYVIDNFLREETSDFGAAARQGGGQGSTFLENITEEAKNIFLERRFGEDGKLAGTNGDDVLDHRKRSDLTFTLPWNDKHVIYHCLPAFQQFISVLRESLVPALGEGLRRYKQNAGQKEKRGLYWQCLEETNQLALLENPSLSCYPKERNAYFRRHLDSHFRINHGTKNQFSPVIDKRKITILFYLNRGWNLATDGGTLRMWVGPDSFPSNLTEPLGEVIEVAPCLNRMLIFWSDAVPHEVRPTSRDRYAATLWLAEVSQ